MPVLGVLIKQGLKLSQRVKRRQQTPLQQQRRTLKKLLASAEHTAFGRHYSFTDILQKRNFIKEFQQGIPVFNYNTLFEKWWHRCLNGEENITWNGRVKYFALSSGTSESASKHIPVTREMVRALRKASIRQMLTLSKYDLPASFFEKGILWLGGSTDLKKMAAIMRVTSAGSQHAGFPSGFINIISREGKFPSRKTGIINLTR